MKVSVALGFQQSEDLPAGSYLGELIKVEDSSSSLRLMFKVIEGHYAGNFLGSTLWYPADEDNEPIQARMFSSAMFSLFSLDMRYSGDFDALEVAQMFVGKHYKVTRRQSLSGRWLDIAELWDGHPFSSPAVAIAKKEEVLPSPPEEVVLSPRAPPIDPPRAKVDERGYVSFYQPTHPLAHNGWVARHRAVCFAYYGGYEQPCHWCKYPLPWRGGKEGINVDHLNGIPGDDRPDNLVPSCQWCNIHRSWVPLVAPPKSGLWEFLISTFATVPPWTRPTNPKLAALIGKCLWGSGIDSTWESE